MHYLVKELVPPILNSLRWYSFKYGWKGDYSSFEEAKDRCTGYDEDHILIRIIDTTNKVKSGDAAYERDGIIYDDVNINHHLLNALLLISGRNKGKLTVLDFGGSLGTSYYQNIRFLSHLEELNWCIIEQPGFVSAGKRLFENEHVRFFNNVEECVAEYPDIDFVLISSALQYLSQPYAILEKLQSHGFPYLMIDLVGFNNKNKDRITIQHVPPIFYGIEASYPCTFFDKAKLKAQLEKNYVQVFEFISEHQKYYVELKPFQYEGSFWKAVTED
jgi:putative methyltransferase (TIGR04325 family)